LIKLLSPPVVLVE